MRFKKISLRLIPKKISVATIFSIGFFLGILLIHVERKMLLENTGLFSENSLYNMKYTNVDCGVLFFYVLKQRLGGAVILAVLTTTYLGLAVCVGTVFWYGLCGGTLLSIAVFRYGIKGIALVLVGMCPQFFLYVPAFLFLMKWCECIYREIYLEKTIKREAGKIRLLPRRILQLSGILMLFFVGCILEGYVNPTFIQGFLKIF